MAYKPYTANPGPNATLCPHCDLHYCFAVVRHGPGSASEYNPTIMCPYCGGVVRQGSYIGEE